MRGCILFISLIYLLCPALLRAQQTIRIVKGKTVVLKANAENAQMYIWFWNGEPIADLFDEVIRVNKEGTYTVRAIGDGCESLLSDPVQIILDDESVEEITVDMQIKNIPESNSVLLENPFDYQVIASNMSNQTATDVMVRIQLPPYIRYQEIFGNYHGTVVYRPETHQLIWNLENMEPNQIEFLNLKLRANQYGNSAIIAEVSSREPDYFSANNTAKAQIAVISLKIPNVFTPNGDGINDVFFIQGLEGFSERTLTIVNRFGNEIYRSSYYENNWDAAQIVDGTYFYLLEATLPSGEKKVFKGYVTIIRNISNP